MRNPGLILIGALSAAWACSSDIVLQPPAQTNPDNPLQPGPVQGGSGGGAPVDTPPPTPSEGNGGTEMMPPVMLETNGGNGGATSSGGPVTPPEMPPQGTGGSPPEPMPCADADGDGDCDDVDPCPNAADDDADRDQDGTPDACDPCADVATAPDAPDSDQDGIPDQCDECGIGVALALEPMFYFPLDEDPLAVEAINLGTVQQRGTYIGPIERGLPGVSDPAGRAVRMIGQQNTEFSRVTVLNASAFPSTALTATFWVRTSQTTDYSIFSYALQGSTNEFGIIVEGSSIRVTFLSSTFAADVDATRISDGAWHFVALSWQQTSGQLYFDGEAAGSPMPTVAGFEIQTPGSVAVTGPLSIRPGGVLVLGQDQDGLNSGFNVAQALQGGLDDVAIYGRALSGDEIRRIYEATTCGETCNGTDDDGDGQTDEGFVGSAVECSAASCEAIEAAGAAFGTGTYFINGAAQSCLF